jgi:hypothetical protein
VETEDVIRIPLPPRPAAPGHTVDNIAADDSIFIPASQAYDGVDPKVTLDGPVGDQTLHGQDTLPLGANVSQAYASGIDPLNPGAGPLDETRVPAMSGFGSAPFAAASTPPPADSAPAASNAVDARSERMFQEQLSKAVRANAAKDWKGAVHALSIAAAIHPENEQVMADLKIAREKKRQAENQ